MVFGFEMKSRSVQHIESAHVNGGHTEYVLSMCNLVRNGAKCIHTQ